METRLMACDIDPGDRIVCPACGSWETVSAAKHGWDGAILVLDGCGTMQLPENALATVGRRRSGAVRSYLDVPAA